MFTEPLRQPEVSKDIAEAGFLAWLVKKLKVKVPFDDNKLYASEILSILLQVQWNINLMLPSPERA